MTFETDACGISETFDKIFREYKNESLVWLYINWARYNLQSDNNILKFINNIHDFKDLENNLKDQFSRVSIIRLKLFLDKNKLEKNKYISNRVLS